MQEKLETQIAMQTEAGREGLEVWRRTVANLTGEQKLRKVFELNEQVRQTMCAGIRDQFPDADDEEIQEIYFNRMLGFHGTSLAE